MSEREDRDRQCDIMVDVMGKAVRISGAAEGEADLVSRVLAAWSGSSTNTSDADLELALTPASSVDLTLEQLSSAVTLTVLKEHAGRLLTFHAAGLALEDGRVVAFVGPSGRGKTTLSRTLGKSYGYVSDETVAVDEDRTVYPYRKPLSLVQEGGPKKQVAPRDAGLKDLPGGPLSLTALVLLDRVDGSEEATVDQVSLLDGMLGLLPEMSYMSSFEDPLVRLATLCEQLGGVKRLTYSDVAQLGGLVEQLAVPGEFAEQWHRAHDMIAPPAEYQIADVLDAVRCGEQLIVIHDQQIRVLSGIAPEIWNAVREGKRLDEIVEDVVARFGEPEDGDAEVLVKAALTGLQEEGLLSVVA